MDKPTYQKPIVLDLNSPAQAAGLAPLVCFAGSSAGSQACLGGGSPNYYSCGTGGSADFQACAGGNTASGESDCFSGATVGVGGWCASGGNPGDVDACTAGPSAV